MVSHPAPDERDAQLSALHADAVARLSALDDSMRQLRSDRGADVADDEHDPEGVTLSSEWARLAGLRAGVARELDEIDGAVDRRAAGADGICADCGRGIPIERLLARPTATRCVDCAAKAGG
ncbi:TraR/DksA family transcriptional regulator [Microbacterium sp. CFBP9034]|uniref:TraR/DksA family transcriptional regulator n=1 Tax=Microbacterium sp. CFBP9034 TaxID=3096540 RepID=UPI002A69E941|nr:TraR/DksA family transcriptional regulator [Microbacterium sp. CFBP9034]MDY0909945.1 TraR/DksA family transcriptional regulator [Microbacterium sp. CFBP9034]